MPHSTAKKKKRKKEKKTPNTNKKKAQVAIVISETLDLKAKLLKAEKYFILEKGKIHEENIL